VIVIGEIGKTCPRCGTFFTGNKCPKCGWEILTVTPKHIEAKKQKIKGVLR